MKSAKLAAERAARASLAKSDADLLANPGFREALAKDTERRRLEEGRLACLLVIGLIPLGVTADFVVYNTRPGQVFWYFILRLVCAVVAAGGYWIHGTEFGRRHVRWLGPPIALIPAAFVGVIIGLEDGFNSSYGTALILILLAVNVAVHWSMFESLLTTLGITAIYTVAGIRGEEPSGGWAHASFMGYYFFLVTGVIVVGGNWLYNRLQFRAFVSRFELERSQSLLKESYTQLERSQSLLKDSYSELEHSQSLLKDSYTELENSRSLLEVSLARLRELDELKGRFFANISHELRTPLTLLLAPIDLLRTHPAVTREARLDECVKTMHDNGLRLLKLINDLLDLVRLEAGRVQLHRVPVDVDSFLRGLVAAVRPTADDRRLRLHYELAPELTRLQADPDKLEKVFLNLLFNSIKFTPAGGKISLQARREGESAVFAVSDTGVGVSAEQLPHLFERFWQADTSSQRKYQGAGIGLALVKELVELHQGTVEVQSVVNQGTTFTVRIPLGVDVATPVAAPPPAAAPAAAPASSTGDSDLVVRQDPMVDALFRRAELHASITPLREPAREWTKPRGGRRPKLLVADDEPDLLRFLRTQLEEDYEVIPAIDGAQAIAFAKQYLPEAILCDMMLPEKDGIQVCRELRASHVTRGIPFLMLTARADDTTKLDALAAGASDFLTKPFSTAELRLRIKNLVNGHQLERDLADQNQRLEATIEQLKETELQLVQSEKMASLGRLSAGIIHEINNPLNFARTGLHMIGRYSQKLPDAERADCEETLQDINEGIERVSHIVSDLRSFSHPDGGRLEMVDVGEVLAASLRFLGAELKEYQIDFRNEVPNGFRVPAIKNKLVQVVLNLLQNSFDALRTQKGRTEPGIVRVQAQAAGGWHRVIVWDNGPGIPEAVLPRIFDPFFTTKEVGQGTGLGLSICYRILGEFGARILVRSEVGKYCEFTLEFSDVMKDPSSAA